MPQEGQKLSQCGSSRDDAVSRGCQFDIMSFSWLPPACYDEALAIEFAGLRGWQYFRDENRTTGIPRKEVALGQYDLLYVSTEYHVLHCTYMWRKMHRAVLKAAPIDGYIGEYNHTKHCEEVLVGERTKDLNSTALMVMKVSLLWLLRQVKVCSRLGSGKDEMAAALMESLDCLGSLRYEVKRVR
ncbi:uncharacterized protein Z518_07394 [Rhinocladiella mackenziei CBS 650.93]|uniref:Rhinocladiella mackenziei CBS 650.93 unplaced genomic scaffold supercont1.5, whole genome shotgun sequence n=1 Tax=Rhinocladiella mackenziei CBS 650.93 TaxID=1442369 RepID=A0A0D2IKW0_9EURO|nr:uncharacterized protein Z518_07394 [Rhinocladiella mackenziei CBS 650.93]KIX03841.1 hypothetical protein Z518_07394 [Rhinocladiella mackenziei CBS 650.93]